MLKYGRTETYKFNIDQNLLNKLAISVNRHPSQVLFLIQLVDGNIQKYKFLELQIKRFFINYSPGDKKEVYRILNLRKDKKFSRPFNNLSPFYQYNKIPRKIKKKYKTEIKRNTLGLNSSMWYILGLENKEYRDFLVGEICDIEHLFNKYEHN
jgi:hypothetical protein